MASSPQEPEGQEGRLSTLNATIEDLNHAKEVSAITPAKTAFESVSVLLKTIRVGFSPSPMVAGLRLIFCQEPTLNQQDYVELGLNCVEICGALDRGTRGKRTEDLSRSVHESMDQLTTWVQPAGHSLDH